MMRFDIESKKHYDLALIYLQRGNRDEAFVQYGIAGTYRHLFHELTGATPGELRELSEKVFDKLYVGTRITERSVTHG